MYYHTERNQSLRKSLKRILPKQNLKMYVNVGVIKKMLISVFLQRYIYENV